MRSSSAPTSFSPTRNAWNLRSATARTRRRSARTRPSSSCCTCYSTASRRRGSSGGGRRPRPGTRLPTSERRTRRRVLRTHDGFGLHCLTPSSEGDRSRKRLLLSNVAVCFVHSFGLHSCCGISKSAATRRCLLHPGGRSPRASGAATTCPPRSDSSRRARRGPRRRSSRSCAPSRPRSARTSSTSSAPCTRRWRSRPSPST
mmetsp:Transcript_18362/g.73378  ORF Transcript_18362/g.73378 Transcript_18362/m.73378 type:complete len:202 (-) Transcript_18362:408-1013(-)